MTKSYTIELPTGPTTPLTDVLPQQGLDLRTLVAAALRRFWVIVTSFLVIFGLVAIITFTQTPLYRAQTVVQLNTNQKNVIDIDPILGGITSSTAVIDTEVLVLGSKSLLTRVAVAERLVDEPEFNPSLRPPKRGPIATLSRLISGPPEDPMAGMNEAERAAAALEGAVEILSRKVSVKRIGTTYLLTVDVTSESPKLAARLANEIAQQYQTQQLEEKYESTRSATAWLQERVDDLRREVEEKERRVELFRAETGLLATDGTTLTEQQIAFMTQQKGALEIELSRARSRYESMQRQIASGAGVEGISEVINSRLVSDLKTQRAIISRRVADLEKKLGPSHPELISARNEAADIDRQISAEVNRIAESLESELRVAQSQINSIQAEIDRSTSQLRGNNINQVRLRELERDADTSRQILEAFLGRSKETRLQQEGLVQADASILSTASVPSGPASPKKLLNLVIGCLLGGLVGGALALLLEIFDNKISSTEDIERKLGSPVLGSVPLIRTAGLIGLQQQKPADYLVDNPLSAFAESIRYMRAAIAFSDLDSETKTVAIASSLPDEGKTSLTLSLGRMSAMSGSRTLVIDGDFRRRQLTEMAGLKPEIGFIEHLFGAGQLSDAIVKDRKTMLDILPLSLSGHTPHDVFGTRAFDELLVRLRSMYDLILIDTGPLLLMAEARVVAGKTDKTILVVRWRHSTGTSVKQSLQLLKTFKADLLGVTLNMVDLNRRRHHRDPGATYKAYRKYYQMETRPPLFGLDRWPWAAIGKRRAGAKAYRSTFAVQVPPAKARRRSEPTDRMSAE